ncbi:MAG: Holliday junction resolvase RuvX [Bacilli bacterium]|jgi:putative Holliday junction resolvase|nr:Holliday junction resolvase RuvX [Bacilli bacterium]
MRYLGLDLGTKSLGLALSDRTGLIASFYKNISYTDEDKLLEEIKDIVEKEHVEKLVLGLPKNMDNSLGWRSTETIEFKEKLEKMLDKEVILEDERLTTKIAENMLIDFDLSRKKRKKVIDGVSAVIILQSYLDRKER